MDVRRRVLLVSGSGGVLLDLLALRPWWQRHDTSWLAVKAADTEVALAGQSVTWLPDLPVVTRVRALPGAARAVRHLSRHRPDIIVSAGGGPAVSVFLAARALRVPTVWVETLTQTGPPGAAGRICSRLAGTVLAQRPSGVTGDAVLIGELY